jgi:hypothetical protein
VNAWTTLASGYGFPALLRAASFLRSQDHQFDLSFRGLDIPPHDIYSVCDLLHVKLTGPGRRGIWNEFGK